jgi:hypothetical protein
MSQALLPLLGASVTIAACYALGALFIDALGAPLRRAERFPLAFVLGASCLHLILFLILTLHVAYWPVVVAIPAACIAIAVWKGSWRLRGEPMPPLGNPLILLWGGIFAIFTVVYFINAWAPEFSSDGSSYHLGFIAHYMRAHGFVGITTNLYASLGQGIELLFLPAFVVGRHSAGALVHLGFLIAVCLAIFTYGRRLGKPWVGAAASLLMYLSPVVGMDGTAAYVDVGVAAIVFSCFYWLEIWEETPNTRFLIPIGLLAGYAYAAKYTAFTILLLAFLWIAIRARKLKPMVVVAAMSLVMVVPWMIKNWVVVQNPLAPFLNKYFRNPNVHVQFESEYSRLLRSYDVENKWSLPLEVTIRGGKTTGLIGPVFLLLPLALLSLRFRAGRRLLAASLFVFAPYFLNVGTRFLIPALPFFSLAICLALEASPVLLAVLIVAHAWASWPTHITRYSDPYVWRLNRIPWKEALRIVPQDDFLRRYSMQYGEARMLEEHVPKGERVLGMNGLSEAYTTRDFLVAFQAGFNESLADTVNMGWAELGQPAVLRSVKFPSHVTRHVRLTQTGTGVEGEQWNIHELRFFSQGKELPRKPEWRLTAFPNPWEIQFAFDNSLATRWRTWERAFPGMYVDVDFGAPAPLDEIRIDTSPDFANVKIRTEATDDAGDWIKLGDDFVNSKHEVTANLRRAATWEMHLRGVNYLLILDTDWGADDFRDDPEGWGLKEVARGYGARLYEVLPLTHAPLESAPWEQTK